MKYWKQILATCFIFLGGLLYTKMFHSSSILPEKFNFKSKGAPEPKGLYMKQLCTGEMVPISNKKRNVLGFSLCGVNAIEKYGKAIKLLANESFSRKLYKNWDVRIYHDLSSINSSFIKSINSLNPNLKFCNVIELGKSLDYAFVNKNGMAWRYIVVGDETVNIACPRDLDSPLLVREEDAVNAWLETGKIFHCMRDNPYHTSTIMGGMWCFRNKKNQKFGKKIMWKIFEKVQSRNPVNHRESDKGDDQNTLNVHIWPLVKNDAVQHDSFLCTQYPGSTSFPTKRASKPYQPFVGCVRPCTIEKFYTCPTACRPPNHKDWVQC